MEPVAPGVWRVRLGQPEAVTPVTICEQSPLIEAMADLPEAAACPIGPGAVRWRSGPRGTSVEIPLADRDPAEQFYGMGLQLGSVNQTSRKRALRVNSDPVGDAGDSHAPVPFVVSTAGYGIYVDTSRYASVYLGSHRKVAADAAREVEARQATATSTQELYAARQMSQRMLVIDVPVASGVDIYVFAGPTSMHVVQRYNLFSGGGCLPPMWGLGVWYRLFGKASQQEATALAKSLRDAQLPCDVLGFEPGWQSQAYSCSFVWNPTLFPEPDKLIADIRGMGFEINLWEHVFVHPTSPLYEPLKPLSGDYEVWSGLVPDLSLPQARAIFADHHRTTLVDKGITGFKLDECDHSDFIRHSSWSFPEASTFPSGLDGEQMHVLLGLLYQQAIHSTFEQTNTRTYSSVRSSGGLAASLPFVLYSDLYDHRDFIRGVLTSGFSGLLWSPEVRHATSREDLLRRIQAVVLSPHALVNAWYIKNPPWLQFDRAKNNADELLEDAAELEAAVRRLFELRMTLLPYLYAAFARYRYEGVPPFRALVLDYPDDAATHKLEDQYMMGDDLLVAPIFAGQVQRDVYLPLGCWYDYFTHQRYDGGQVHSFPVERDTILMFVRSGAILPLAAPVQHVTPRTVFEITPHAFGPVDQLRPARLFEDDGVSFDFSKGNCNWVMIHPDRSVIRVGEFKPHRYDVKGWRAIGS